MKRMSGFLKSLLSEVPVEGEGFFDFETSHDNKACAVGETVFLVITL